METESLRAHIEHESAELRALYPRIKDCHTALMRWTDAAGEHHSLHLDIRWPQHQTLVSGPARESAAAAVEAGFHTARERVSRAAWASR
jgi:hypothetical protein